MGHVGEEVGADVVADLAELLVVEGPGVAAHAGDDYLRFEELRVGGQLFVVDQPAHRIHLNQIGVNPSIRAAFIVTL